MGLKEIAGSGNKVPLDLEQMGARLRVPPSLRELPLPTSGKPLFSDETMGTSSNISDAEYIVAVANDAHFLFKRLRQISATQAIADD